MSAADDKPADEIFYGNGNEAFVNDEYTQALDFYNKALELAPGKPEYLLARSQAFIKTEDYWRAKEDAMKALKHYKSLSESKLSEDFTAATKAWLRAGLASHNLGQFKEAKDLFTEGYEFAVKFEKNDRGLAQWIAWSEEKIAKFGDDISVPKSAPTEPKEECARAAADPPASSKPPTACANPPAACADPPAAQSNPAATNNLMPTPKIKHDWYQTETHVIIEVRMKNMKNDDVKVDVQEITLSVTAKLDSGSEYSLELDLAHPVIPEQSSHRTLSTKIEIKLRKAEGARWNSLEGDGKPNLLGIPQESKTSIGVKAPYASGRDWSKMEKLLAEEADEKKEGEAALNEMFQKIYADASDETKKAMNKSFLESGGTVLSTNWNEVQGDKVKVQPPDGMEWKNWEN